LSVSLLLLLFLYGFFLAVGTQPNGALPPPTGMECGSERPLLIYTKQNKSQSN
jgi:hypothetical protein